MLIYINTHEQSQNSQTKIKYSRLTRQEEKQMNKQKLNTNLTLYKSYTNHWTTLSQFSRSGVSNSLRPHESQHARPPCPSPIHPSGHLIALS